MKLSAYLEAREESQTAFAERARAFVGAKKPRIGQATISSICNGNGCQARVAYAVIRASQAEPAPGGGTVTLEDIALSTAAPKRAKKPKRSKRGKSPARREAA
jgi:hypothetical protein